MALKKNPVARPWGVAVPGLARRYMPLVFAAACLSILLIGE